MGLGMNAEIKLRPAPPPASCRPCRPKWSRTRCWHGCASTATQPKGLRQSQRVSARLLIEERPDVLMLPRGPFVESDGGRFAYVVQDGIAVRTPDPARRHQHLGDRNPRRPQPGDKVVIAGTDTFDDAARVSIND